MYGGRECDSAGRNLDGLKLDDCVRRGLGMWRGFLIAGKLGVVTGEDLSGAEEP
jgi:hypothetical protein